MRAVFGWLSVWLLEAGFVVWVACVFPASVLSCCGLSVFCWVLVCVFCLRLMVFDLVVEPESCRMLDGLCGLCQKFYIVVSEIACRQEELIFWENYVNST